MPVNLEPAKRFVTTLMTDTIRITEPYRLEDAMMDDDGELHPLPDVVLYEGPAMINSPSQESTREPEGGGTVQENTYTIRIPIDGVTEDSVCENCEVVVLTSQRDPHMVGQTMIVSTVFYSTFSITVKFHADLRVLKRDA